jgi:hypothetical protein
LAGYHGRRGGPGGDDRMLQLYLYLYLQFQLGKRQLERRRL